MTIELTPEQQLAVDRRDGPLFLSAGAGSGKTRVLVERFVSAVCDDDVPVERILAITFTEKAAAELKGRLRERFLERGEREHAREAEAAWIGTIHGFCSRLLRMHALAAGLDPEYRVLDESGAARIAYAAFDGALEEFLLRASDPERLDLVASYTPDKLRQMVHTVHGRLRAGGQRVPELPPPPEPPAPAGERAALEQALATAQAELADAGDGKRVQTALGQLERCQAVIAALAPDAIGDAEDYDKTLIKPGNTKALGGPGVAGYNDAHDAWVSLCAAHRAAQQYRHLRKLLSLYADRYEQGKREVSALDFDDLELIARDLLRDHPDVRAAWTERFLHVMVDEYQDTNPLQDELIDLIAAGRLFAVGDDRQSIYGFRHADVEGFRDRRAAAAEQGRAARLTYNFRSSPEVLGVVNAAFAHVWEEDGYESLAVGAEPSPRPDGTPSVDLLVVDAAKSRWDDAGFDEGDPFGPSLHALTVWRAAEARLLAARIGALVREDDRFGFGDVAVLMRAATDMPYYERALNERGIPTYAAGARGYFSQQQIGDLRAYLATLANPLDGVALYGLLASPLVGASLDALALVRLHSRGASRDPWWALDSAFCGSDDPTGLVAALPSGDAEKLRAFVPRFADERRAAARLSLETVIDRAVSSSGYDRAVLAMPSGERRMANVRKLMRLARDFESREGRDLRRFIDYVDEQELISAREGEAPLETESIDAVRLMTIHAAKGLEFPVVCVADMGRAGREEDNPLQVSRDGRVGLQLLSLRGKGPAALDQEQLKAEEEARTEAEEKRVFYVAMTRAEKHLIVSGATDVEKWPPPKPLGRPIDWALPALAAAGVAPVICSPETVDDVLPVADRVPATHDGGDEEAGRRGRPEFAPVQKPVSLPLARLSYSALEHYARCGYRFYLERVARLRDGGGAAAAPVAELVPVAGDDELGVDPVTSVWDAGGAPAEAGDEGQLGLPLAAATATIAPVAGALDARVRGTIVHELLEHVDFARPAAPQEADIAARLESHGERPTPEDVADLRQMVDAFLDSPLAERVRAASGARKELPFAFPLAPDGAGESILVNGVIDLYAVEGDRALVVDYKSDRLEGADPVAFCDEHYGTQRLVYALAALKSGAERVEVIHSFLETPETPVVAEFTAADARDLEARLVDLAGGVIAGRFEPTDDPHRELCATCPGRPALCCWDESRTLAPKLS